MSKIDPAIIALLPIGTPARLTRHAACRSQKRSIPQYVIDLLIDYGQEVSAGGGCCKYHFTGCTWNELAKRIGARAKYIERYRSAYVVVSADCWVVTAGWLY